VRPYFIGVVPAAPEGDADNPDRGQDYQDFELRPHVFSATARLSSSAGRPYPAAEMVVNLKNNGMTILTGDKRYYRENVEKTRLRHRLAYARPLSPPPSSGPHDDGAEKADFVTATIPP